MAGFPLRIWRLGPWKVAESRPAALQKIERVSKVKRVYAGSICYDDSEQESPLRAQHPALIHCNQPPSSTHSRPHPRHTPFASPLCPQNTSSSPFPATLFSVLLNCLSQPAGKRQRTWWMDGARALCAALIALDIFPRFSLDFNIPLVPLLHLQRAARSSLKNCRSALHLGIDQLAVNQGSADSLAAELLLSC